MPLRLTIFFLRIAIGLNLFYLGWSSLFDHPLSLELSTRSVGGLYDWLATPSPFATIPSVVFAWVFLIIGTAITIGLFTRFVSALGILLILASILPSISLARFSATQFVNGEIVILFGLAVLLFGKAGTYLGIDKFLHWRKNRRDRN